MSEYEVEKECRAETVVSVLPPGVLFDVKSAEKTVGLPGWTSATKSQLRSAIEAMEQAIQVPYDCTFTGDVLVVYAQGYATWTCPDCGTEHQEEVD